MILSKYRFYIVKNKEDKIEVTPHYKELNKKYAKESGQQFFRASLDGKLVLTGQDYNVIKNSSLNDSLEFIIEKYSSKSGNWLEYHRANLNKLDCKFDYEKRTCELKTTTADAYTEILNNYENTYDLVKLAPEITKIDLHKRSLIQVYILGSDSVTNLFGGTYWEAEVNEAIDDSQELQQKYYFSHVKTGNEIYIRNARISGVNGVYAGTDGQWSQWDGYTCYVEVLTPEATKDFVGSICIKRNSDNAVLYKSRASFVFSDINNIHLGSWLDAYQEEIEMVNQFDSSDIFTIQHKDIFTYHIFCRLLCDVSDVDGVSTYALPQDDFIVDNKNYKRCIGLKGGLFFCTSRTVTEPTKYGINDYGEYFTNEFIPASAGIGRALPICRSAWANASLWYVYDNSYEYFEEKSRKRYTLRDSYSIGAAIKALLKKIAPDIQHEATSEYSQFLYGSTSPLNLARFYVFIAQKTNILKGEYDQPAQKAEISFKELMNMLKDCFKCYWYIEDKKLKIEHIYFFMNGGTYSYNSENIQLDFTAAADQFNKKPISYFQSQIEYDKSELSQRYEFNWADDVTDLFGGVTIDVNAEYVQKDKTEEISINKFSSDVDFMLFNPENFSNDGFALLCPVKTQAGYELPIISSTLLDENEKSYKAIVQNWYASWAYLIRFYLLDAPAYDLKINVIGEVRAQNIKNCMKHSIEFPLQAALTQFQLIKTNIGYGKIEEVNINLNTRNVKILLTYKPQ